MFTYLCFYKGRELTLQAPSSYAAQLLAAKQFKARRSYDVTVMLAANEAGEPVVHTADF